MTAWHPQEQGLLLVASSGLDPFVVIFVEPMAMVPAVGDLAEVEALDVLEEWEAAWRNSQE